MSTEPTPLLHLPGHAFTIWMRPRAIAACATSASPKKISLPGHQFTIWSRPQLGSVPAPKTAPLSEHKPSASPNASLQPWWSRCAVVAVPVLGALWFVDHRSQSQQLNILTENHAAETDLKTQFQGQAQTLGQKVATLEAQLPALQAKHTAALAERDTAMKLSATAQRELQTLSADAGSATQKLANLTNEMAALKSTAQSKEDAWNNSLSALKEAASKAQHTAAQRELEQQQAIAKVEAERATALKEAAQAAAAATQLKAELEAVRKK